MKERIISNCEEIFIKNTIKENLRIDGRSLDEFRGLEINFGGEFGSVFVSLGETKVVAQVTCNVTEPKAIRPNEGLLFINVELGPMASNNYESKRVSENSIQLNRILERVFKDSRCVDLESLCILSEEKAWNCRVDINVLNHDGNVIDCASVACLAALAHFKRPDVTLSGTNVVVHSFSEKEPIPLVLHHYPVCVSFALFNNGKLGVADPTSIEECISEANLVLGINTYKELCGMHLGGTTLTSSQLLLRCVNKGAERAKIVVEMIKCAIEKDSDARINGNISSMSEKIHHRTNALLWKKPLAIKLRKFQININSETNDYTEESKVNLIRENTAILIPETKSTQWIMDSSSSDEKDV
ncbi:uncharacterized protein LOC134835705 [Culicoides brevitarsis]|uniref:uncharacterized protein LOC134835705 n=1 Tax=Culicoides brevitarsis TaxID=469753 RepID=UPI00307C41D6